jgi:hypothetical protein
MVTTILIQVRNSCLVSTAVHGRLWKLSDDERKELVCALVSRVTTGEEINLKMATGQAQGMDDSKARLRL